MQYETSDFIEAMQAPGVARSLDFALRDVAIRREFKEERRGGATVDASIVALAERFHLSEERIRAIVYRK